MALLGLRSRLMVRTANLITELIADDENNDQGRAIVYQLVKRRSTVAGACDPNTRKKPCWHIGSDGNVHPIRTFAEMPTEWRRKIMAARAVLT
ncbi:hypothetical protein [Brucella pituitosa]|uniref:hypothetical protein n=1 Tax=Brucella pituitosa TaxID=571256 RepID=UPI0015E27103